VETKIGARNKYSGLAQRAFSALKGRITALALLAAVVLPGSAFAQDSALDSGDTAWMLTATALVLFMTIPGLSLFYAGMVRSKNVLSVLMQCFAITALASVVWAVIGYTIAFNTDGMEGGVVNLHSFFGGFGQAFLNGVTADSVSGSIPESVWIVFQMTFFIITPALICGGFAERMKFSAMMLFMGFWMVLVYAPICHMAWSGDGGLFWDWGTLDFAGGTVVHINAGIAALVACIMVGKRTGYPDRPMPPHNLTLTVIGAGMLWVGWFGFNAGSAAAANGSAGMAMLVTQLSTAMATLTWMGIEWIKHGKPSVLGAVTGAVAGLVAITPASGSSGPMGALAIGFAAGVGCFWAATSLKKMMGYDDSLDAFGIHGIGGIIGAMLTGIFASAGFGGQVAVEDLVGGSVVGQLIAQGKAVGFTIIYCGVLSFVILKAIDLTIGLRVEEEDESQGLDITLHEETGYIL